MADAKAAAASAADDVVMPAVEGFTPELLPDKDRVYYNDYSTLVQQQGMLQDHVRTSLYQFSMLENVSDFAGKTVLDVGAGTGILSFFAAKAGAARVYAIEASGMALKAEKLVKGNDLDNIIKVVNQKVEEVTLDERVDVLVSEPLGIALVNERMLESYLRARDALLKPGGKMFPDRATLYAAPFSDDALYQEQYQKAAFWTQPDFFGVDLNPLREDALTFYYSQPVVGPVAPHTIVAPATGKLFDFTSMSLEQLQRFEIPLNFTISAIIPVHGVCLWFDCNFPGISRNVVLGTSPSEPLTHWYQVRCMLRSPLALGVGHTLKGTLLFEANESRGYNIHMTLINANTGVKLANTVVSQCALHHFQYTTQQTASTYYSPTSASPSVSVASVE